MLTKIYISVRYVKVIEFKKIIQKNVYLNPFNLFAFDALSVLRI